eukprot:TRINITY_DN13048_c0_g1_i1.p1 TRINITY_DN13048_c0_g1~~TRINITY_DN13048_c0_g1_i1.p1  ORF type:complete len:104 (+),score=31.10 TRINITY_DN13048_c0_g1_i1:53-364(+)
MADEEETRLDEARKRVEGRRVSTKDIDDRMSPRGHDEAGGGDAEEETSPSKRELPASLLPQLKRLGPNQVAEVADALRRLQKAGVSSVHDVEGLARELRSGGS